MGSREAYPILIKGLHRLEYRGYDSAGVAIINAAGQLSVYKSQGKVSVLENFCDSKDVSGNIGIAHTRWATHGEPSDCNAHPHFSNSRRIAIVHNGTIENYSILKAALEEHGCTFHSETDTEVLVELIEYIFTSTKCELVDAVRAALDQVVGAYAIAVLHQEDPDTIIVARKSSPLVLGIGDGETFLASDATPIIEYTNQVIYLRDDEMAVIHRNAPLEVFNKDKKPAKVDIQTLQMSVSQLEKGGYPHFMLKEIFEQPNTLKDCIRGRVSRSLDKVQLSAIQDHGARFLSARRVLIVACGTSWHAGLIGGRLIENLARIPAQVVYASEFRYSNPVINHDDVVIAISQSGETADTLAAIQLAKENGAFVYGVCNVVGSSIARATDTGTYIHVGPEIGVASTKAFTGQVTVLAMMAVAIAQLRGTITGTQVRDLCGGILDLPRLIERTLKLNDDIEKLSRIYTYAHNFLYLGRGYNFPSALEGALKLKEISYIHSEAYASGELKHGTISLIENGTLVVALGTYTPLFDKAMSNVVEVKARGAKVLALTTESCREEMAKHADALIVIPDTDTMFLPSLGVVPLQLFAYYVALQRGCDIDKPRNLAKSVTVE